MGCVIQKHGEQEYLYSQFKSLLVYNSLYMNYYQFFKFIQNNTAHPPSASSWPGEISFNSDIWSSLKKLFSFTKKDGFEYEVSLFYADGDIVSTKFTRGSREHVIARHQVNLRYVPRAKIRKYEKEIYVDNTLVAKVLKSPGQLPKSSEIGLIFNAHSHPQQEYNDKQVYSFFSETDLNSLAGGNSISLVLITDEVWIAGKTDKAHILTAVEKEKLLLANSVYISNGNIEELIKNHLDIGIVFYRGDIGKKLLLVN